MIFAEEILVFNGFRSRKFPKKYSMNITWIFQTELCEFDSHEKLNIGVSCKQMESTLRQMNDELTKWQKSILRFIEHFVWNKTLIKRFGI